ncbi:MAG TPA: hypothetical protein DCR71_03680 [Dehalococcoidia bacterium]|nr:hypothetical protein [Dehalococcoidia bacterium]
MSNRLAAAVQSLFERQTLSKPSVWALIIANLYPIIGVIFFDWQTYPLLLFFWTENLVIGFYTVLKMLVASGDNAKPAVKLFTVPFFCLHYGIFTLVHGVFVVALFGSILADDSINAGTLTQQVLDYQLFWGVLALLISHGISFFKNYIGRNEYQQAELTKLMFQPYGRVVILHITIIIGGFLSVFLGSPLVALLFLIILKIVIDIATHLREHRKYRE